MTTERKTMEDSNRGPAEALLERLLEKRLLELSSEGDRDRLARGISQVMGARGEQAQLASRLAEWLMGQEIVTELFASDDELASMLEQV